MKLTNLKKIGFFLFLFIFFSGLSFSQPKESLKVLPPLKSSQNLTEKIVNDISLYGDESWDDQFYAGNVPNRSSECVSINGSDVYIGGRFTKAGNVICNYVAKWNPVSGWSNVGEGFAYTVLQLKTIDNNIYAGGEFGDHYGVQGNYISVWDGINWSVPDYGTDNIVCAFEKYEDKIIVGGGFFFAGNLYARRIASLNPSTLKWSTLGDGFNNVVLCLLANGSDLYAAGAFLYSGNTKVDYAAKWDRNLNKWVSFISGTDAPIRSLAIYGDDFYFGGDFTHIGGIAA